MKNDATRKCRQGSGVRGTVGVSGRGAGDAPRPTAPISGSAAEVSADAPASGSGVNTAEGGKIHGTLRRICLRGPRHCEAENYTNNEKEEKERLRVDRERTISKPTPEARHAGGVLHRSASQGRLSCKTWVSPGPAPEFCRGLNEALTAQTTRTTTRSAPKRDSLTSQLNCHPGHLPRVFCQCLGHCVSAWPHPTNTQQASGMLLLINISGFRRKREKGGGGVFSFRGGVYGFFDLRIHSDCWEP